MHEPAHFLLSSSSAYLTLQVVYSNVLYFVSGCTGTDETAIIENAAATEVYVPQAPRSVDQAVAHLSALLLFLVG